MEYIIKIGQNYIGCDNHGRYTEVTNLNDAIRGDRSKLQNIINNCVAPKKRGKCKLLETTTKPTKAVAIKDEDNTNPLSAKADMYGIHNAIASLNQQLSVADQEVADVYHYIEFNNLNACEGFKVYKLLQNKLRQRRIIKDKKLKLELFSELTIEDVLDGTFETKMNNLASKTYKPRVLTELFDKK